MKLLIPLSCLVLATPGLKKYPLPREHNSLFKIGIDRKLKSDNCTQGYISVNDTVIAYTLELPDKNNKEYISSIPKDTYDATIRTDGSLGWRVELKDVPNRTVVEIHVGNYTSNTTGCIVIGKGVSTDNCTVSNSKDAIQALQTKFNDFTKDLILNQGKTDPIDIQVEITGI